MRSKRSNSTPRNRLHKANLWLDQLEGRVVPSAVAPPGYSTFNAEIDAVTTAAPYGPSQVYQGYGFNRVIFQQGSNYYLGNGAGQTIAIVDAFNDAHIATDLAQFDAQLGVAPPPSFTVLNQTGGTSLSGVTSASSNRSATYGWSIEESLDVEWAHTIAPDANIVLFEANSNSNANLYTAVETAAKASTYTQYGLPPAGVVTNSWGGGESAAEIASDPDFTSVGNTVTFVFSSGDSHIVEYPSSSPNVLAVGGTQLKLQTSGFGTTYNGEGWYDTSVSNAGGGGTSAYETEPSYQLGVETSGKRQTPDVAMNGAGASDVLVLDQNYPYSGYYGVYGTSEAAPMTAAELSIVDQGLTLAEGTFTTLGNAQAYVYSMPGVMGGASPSSGTAYHDITGVFTYLHKSGSTTVTTTYTATPGYDTLTGLGSPIPSVFIPDMISYAVANGSSPNDPGGVWEGGNPGAGSSGGAAQPGQDDPDFMAQTAGNFAGEGHLAESATPATIAFSPSQLGTASGLVALSSSGAAQGIVPTTATLQAARSATTSGNYLFPTATVVAAKMGETQFDAAQPATPVENATTGSSVVSNFVAPMSLNHSAVDALFTGTPAANTGGDVNLDSQAVSLIGEDGGTTDLALAAGMAMALTGSWGNVEWEPRRNQVSGL